MKLLRQLTTYVKLRTIIISKAGAKPAFVVSYDPPCANSSTGAIRSMANKIRDRFNIQSSVLCHRSQVALYGCTPYLPAIVIQLA